MVKHLKRFSSFKSFIFLGILLVIMSYDLLESKTVFPLTEGWWETYAWIQTKTGLLYESYNLQFPPFYIWLVGFLIKVVGFDLWSIRLVMVALHLVIILLMYSIVSRLDGYKGAMFGVGVATTLVMLNPVYFAKDYHTIVEFLIYFSILSVLLISKRKSVILSSTCLGFSLIALTLTKQNIGVFFGVSIFLYLLIVSTRSTYSINKKMFYALCAFIVGGSVPILLVVNEFGFQWLSIFQGNDSKGSLVTVLFRFLIEPSLLRIEIFALIVVMYYWGASLLNAHNRYNDRLLLAIIFVPILGILYTFKYSSILYIYALAWPMARIFIFKMLQKNVTHKYFFVILYALAYCGTQTAGFNEVSLALLIAIMLSDLYSLLIRSIPKINERVLLISTPLIISSFFLVKSVSNFSYNWWGLTNRSIVRDEYIDIKNNYIGNILLDSETAKILNYVISKKADLNNEDTIFATPSIPFLYVILEKLPIINPVLWFDVTSSKDLSVYDNFQKKSSPKYIFWLKTPDYVYDGHFNLRKKDPVMFNIDEDLINKVYTGEYSVDAVFFPSEIKLFKSFSQKTSVKILDGWSPLSYCKNRANHCSVLENDYKLVNFKNEYYMRRMVESTMPLIDSDKFVFYVLRKTHN